MPEPLDFSSLDACATHADKVETIIRAIFATYRVKGDITTFPGIGHLFASCHAFAGRDPSADQEPLRKDNQVVQFDEIQCLVDQKWQGMTASCTNLNQHNISSFVGVGSSDVRFSCDDTGSQEGRGGEENQTPKIVWTRD